MEAYNTAKREDQTKIIDKIELILQTHAADQVYIPQEPVKEFKTEDDSLSSQLLETATTLLNSEESTSASSLTSVKKKELQRCLLKYKDLENAMKKYEETPKPGSKAPSKTAMINELKKILKILSGSQIQSSEEKAGLTYIEKMQHLVNSCPLLPGAIVEYGSGSGNNCFFHALIRLGYTGGGTAEEMRKLMDDNREGSPGYHHGGMIDIADIADFANRYYMTVQLFTVIRNQIVAVPALGNSTRNGIYYILHNGNHFMPIIMHRKINKTTFTAALAILITLIAILINFWYSYS